MALVSFKKGLLTNLPAQKTAGTFYVTTDERAIYLDVDGESRIRLGDFQEFASVSELTKNANPNTTALYYVSDINCLAKWNGTEYVQINKDTGMTSVEVTGEGNAVTAAVYSADGRKLTLTKGATYMTAADVDSKVKVVSDYVGSIPTGYEEQTNVIDYINKKAQEVLDSATGGSTESAASVKQALDAYKASNDQKVAANTTAAANAQTAAENAQADVDALEAKVGTIADGKTVAGLISEAKTQADKGVTDAATAKAAADAAQASADSANTKIDAAVEAATADLDYEATGMGKGKTIKTLSQVDGKIAAEFEDIQIVQSQVTGLADTLKALSTTDTSIQEAINAEQKRAEGVESGLRTDVDAIKGDYLKTSDKDALQSAINTEKNRMDVFMASADLTENAVDTLKEIQDYINSDGTAAAEMTNKIGNLETTVGKAAEGENPATGLVKSVADNASAITAERTRAEGVEATLSAADATNLQAAKDYADGKITDLGIGNYAKQVDLDAHTGDEVVHITAAERTKWNGAVEKQHEHTNKTLLDTYSQTEENLADAVSKKHSHANATVLDNITAEKVSAWDSAQANAEATAASKLSEAKTALETAIGKKADQTVLDTVSGKVDANETAITSLQDGKADKATTLAGYGITDAYKKTETYTQTEVDAKLTWADF